MEQNETKQNKTRWNLEEKHCECSFPCTGHKIKINLGEFQTEISIQFEFRLKIQIKLERKRGRKGVRERGRERVIQMKLPMLECIIIRF